MDVGLYAYPWDLADEGVPEAVALIANAGFRSVHVALAYHAGRFVLPHNPRGRVRFAQDGSLYFAPDPVRYGRLQPRVSDRVGHSLPAIAGLLSEANRVGLDLVGWVVGAHNTWLGERHPECVVENAFGDRYLHSLSPAHPAVRAYLAGLAADVASHGPAAIELESFGYLGFRHGFHHEITGVELDPAEEALLALAFGPTELAAAEAAGVDGAGVRDLVARTLLEGWAAPPRRAARAARALGASAAVGEDITVLHRIEASLLAEVAAAVRAASPGTQVRLIGFAPDAVIRAAAPHLDAVITPYPRRIEDIAAGVAHLRDLGAKQVRGGYRALAPLRVTARSAAQTVDAWRAAAADGLNVYNYGLMTTHAFGHVRRAIRGGTA